MARRSATKLGTKEKPETPPKSKEVTTLMEQPKIPNQVGVKRRDGSVASHLFLC